MHQNLKIYGICCLLLLGSIVISGVVLANDDESVSRVAGDNRYATAAKIALEAFPDGAEHVILTRGDVTNDFADGLSACYLAGRWHAPVLLTSKDELPKETLDALHALNATYIAILGGTQAIAEDVDHQLLNTLQFQTTRIEGATRAETSIRVIEAGSFQSDFEKVYIVNGWNSADAMIAGSVAYDQGIPIVVDNTLRSEMSKPVQAALEEWDVKEVVVIGGAAVVSEEYAEHVQAELDVVTSRIDGANRFETARNFAETEIGYNVDQLLLVNGHSLSDAVGASSYGSPMLYINNNGDLSHAHNQHVIQYLDEILDNNGHVNVTVLGGTAVVNQDLFEQIEEHISPEGEQPAGPVVIIHHENLDGTKVDEEAYFVVEVIDANGDPVQGLHIFDGSFDMHLDATDAMPRTPFEFEPGFYETGVISQVAEVVVVTVTVKVGNEVVSASFTIEFVE